MSGKAPKIRHIESLRKGFAWCSDMADLFGEVPEDARICARCAKALCTRAPQVMNALIVKHKTDPDDVSAAVVAIAYRQPVRRARKTQEAA